MTEPIKDYQAVVRDMTTIDRMCFAEMFIGILSWHVPERKWRKALDVAKNLTKEMNDRLKPAPATGPRPDADKGGSDRQGQ